MAKPKSAKKFEHRHLKDELKRRKTVKSKQKLYSKKPSSRPNAHNETNQDGSGVKSTAAAFENMTVDEFFQGGFEVPELAKKKRKRTRGTDGAAASSAPKSKKPKVQLDDESDDDNDSGSGSGSGSDVAPGGVIDVDEDSHSSGSEDEDDEATHQQDLARLADKDPEFHKYLQENDAELLDFEQGEFDNIEQLSENEDEDDADVEHDIPSGSLELDTVEKWEKAIIELNSLRSMKEMALAFHSAAHMNDAETKAYKYTVTNSDVYNKILLSSLKHIPTIIAHHIPLKHLPNGKIHLNADAKKLRTLAPLIRSHSASILHLLCSLSDSNTIRTTLSSLLSLLPYILSFRNIVKELGKVVAGLWSDPASDDATRITAFLLLRKMITIGDAGIKESVLKTAYQALIKGCRNTNIHTIDAINLMKNSAAELWGIDQSVGYTTGFDFIRQLAIHLRSTITKKTKDSYKVVYNWQCIHSLDFWSRVLAQNCTPLKKPNQKPNKSRTHLQLHPLIYPVTQLTLGVMRLIPSAQYFALRFQLFRSLLRISLATNTYIPLASALYEVLTSREMKRPSKPGTGKPLDFSIAIRAGKSLLGTRVYQDGVGEQIIELFSEFFTLWCKSVAFPELVLPVVVMLKRWLKDASDKKSGNKNSRINSAISLLVQKLDANAAWIEQKRAKVTFAPNNRSGVEKFLQGESWEDTPLGAYTKVQRKIRDEKRKLLEQSRNEKPVHGKAEESDDDDDDVHFNQESDNEKLLL